MTIGSRVLALIIGMAFCFGTLPLVMSGTGWLLNKLGSFSLLLIPDFPVNHRNLLYGTATTLLY